MSNTSNTITSSTHRVDVVPIRLEPHPNADSLSIVRIYGFTCCVRTADWIGRDLGAYIQPDSIVPDTPQFAFLDGHRRIRVKRLRGIISMGLLVPAPDGACEGDDVAAALGVTRYEPPMACSTGGQAAPPPRGYRPHYDVESARRYAADAFVDGEMVAVTEKIHGANGRWCFDGESFHAGSRTEWKIDAPEVIWWQALHDCEALRDALLRMPLGWTVYGEVYGQVQDLKYGVQRGVRVAVFDIFDGTSWLSFEDARSRFPELPWVPTLYVGPYAWSMVEALAEGPSMIPGAAHVREGCVVKPLVERGNDVVGGRVNLKVIGNGYLEKS